MADTTLNSGYMQERLDRWRAGDRAAVNDLLRIVIKRLQKLARKMLLCYPSVSVHVDAEDVLQNSLLRLLRTLQRLKPKTTRDFFNLAAVHIRRELIDLARSKRVREATALEKPLTDSAQKADSVAAEAADLERWVAFHEAVDLLPVEEREVLCLVFYHGWTQSRIAELFNVDVRTIRRRWAAACENIKLIVGMNLLK